MILYLSFRLIHLTCACRTRERVITHVQIGMTRVTSGTMTTRIRPVRSSTTTAVAVTQTDSILNLNANHPAHLVVE